MIFIKNEETDEYLTLEEGLLDTSPLIGEAFDFNSMENAQNVLDILDIVDSDCFEIIEEYEDKDLYCHCDLSYDEKGNIINSDGSVILENVKDF